MTPSKRLEDIEKRLKDVDIHICHKTGNDISWILYTLKQAITFFAGALVGKRGGESFIRIEKLAEGK